MLILSQPWNMRLRMQTLLIDYIKIFSKSLKSENLMNIYEIFEKPLIKILAFMEIEGIKIDNIFLKKLSEKFEKKIKS